MYSTKTTWTESRVDVVIGAAVPVIIRLSSDEAVALYNDLSIRAADLDLYNKDGVFTIGGRSYELTAGQWASIYRTLGEWYEEYFDAFVSDSVFGSATPFTLRAVK